MTLHLQSLNSFLTDGSHGMEHHRKQLKLPDVKRSLLRFEGKMGLFKFQRHEYL